jgi:hypothetical protein
MSESNEVLVAGYLRLSVARDGSEITGFRLDIAGEPGQWHRMATTRPLSHVIFLDDSGQRRAMDLAATSCAATPSSLELSGNIADEDGANWRLKIRLAVTDVPGQLLADYQLETDKPRKVLNWVGPSLYAGEGSYGAAKDEALFPGLEYLLDQEPSSDTRFAAPKYADRTLPHAYKITIPLMAVSYQGRAVGLAWDPNQDWHSAWRHPAALFSSPNRLQEGAHNHLMALCAPAVERRWRDEGALEAHTPVTTRRLTLSAGILARPTGGVQAILRAWVETAGLPPAPEPGHDYAQNVGLCVRSFLDVAWDEQAEGWHHTLSDPWGPRYEPNLANLLWRYGRWDQGEPALRARARDQVRRAVARARQADPAKAPHMELALVFGHVADALEAEATAARAALAQQDPEGFWPWKPEAVSAVADFKTDERLALMGAEGESASGFTASRARPVLQYALHTGDAESIAAARRAADWCNTQRRPEGAQAWELHLHVPDVLAVPYLIDLNLGVYELTGEGEYLDTAVRWAWTGLPFTYLWNGYYRPIMRYGTVPVFGVTFHDVQPWFGVIVHWNGLVYAGSLFRLARYRPCDGPMDWARLAEAITRHGMQEQVDYGPHLGMYPDAYSPVKGDEEYTWWLNPQLLGLVTFPLAGLRLGTDPLVCHVGQGSRLHVTSGATVLKAQHQSRLGSDAGQGSRSRLLLADAPGQSSFTLIGSADRPARISCEGMSLPEAGDLDVSGEGWSWLPSHNVALVKVTAAQEVSALDVVWLPPTADRGAL